jgi:hypothetical protein
MQRLISEKYLAKGWVKVVSHSRNTSKSKHKDKTRAWLIQNKINLNEYRAKEWLHNVHQSVLGENVLELERNRQNLNDNIPSYFNLMELLLDINNNNGELLLNEFVYVKQAIVNKNFENAKSLLNKLQLVFGITKEMLFSKDTLDYEIFDGIQKKILALILSIETRNENKITQTTDSIMNTLKK